MVSIFTLFCDILVFPLYHFLDDSFMGILFYLLLLAFVFELVAYFVRGCKS